MPRRYAGEPGAWSKATQFYICLRCRQHSSIIALSSPVESAGAGGLSERVMWITVVGSPEARISIAIPGRELGEYERGNFDAQPARPFETIRGLFYSVARQMRALGFLEASPTRPICPEKRHPSSATDTHRSITQL